MSQLRGSVAATRDQAKRRRRIAGADQFARDREIPERLAAEARARGGRSGFAANADPVGAPARQDAPAPTRAADQRPDDSQDWWMPHSVFSSPAQRPERGSSADAAGLGAGRAADRAVAFGDERMRRQAARRELAADLGGAPRRQGLSLMRGPSARSRRGRGARRRDSACGPRSRPRTRRARGSTAPPCAARSRHRDCGSTACRRGRAPRPLGIGRQRAHVGEARVAPRACRDRRSVSGKCFPVSRNSTGAPRSTAATMCSSTAASAPNETQAMRPRNSLDHRPQQRLAGEMPVARVERGGIGR